MQCPSVLQNFSSDATRCEQCGALRVIRRTTLGVFVGWAGHVGRYSSGIMLFVPLTFLPFLGHDMDDYPWIALLPGTGNGSIAVVFEIDPAYQCGFARESEHIWSRGKLRRSISSGICGTFMGGIAVLAKQAGYRVTGCDANVYPPMSTQLEAQGIELIEGFGVEQLSI